ncbi:MAG: prolyl oligopeptidase family serine peptidase [Desulfobacteraceae bacterium]|nr:prolyl oligopeptidase family serine peptidase [Desulfobacteraceae bacterium]
MKLTEFIQLAKMLSRLTKPGKDKPDPNVTEQRCLDIHDSDSVYDLYQPRRNPRATVIAVHGAVFQGRNDKRLVHFARCLAKSGIACAVPTLEGLSSCKWDIDDLDVLGSLVNMLASNSGQRVGMIGFSYGGSYALVTASRPDVAARTRFVLAFGAYYSVKQLFDWYVANKKTEPVTESQWDNAIYIRLIFAYNHSELLPDPEKQLPLIKSLLMRYCTEADQQEKREFYEQHLRSLDLFDIATEKHDPDILDALSPANKLAGLQCQVSLLHGKDDSIVPPWHTEQLYKELSETGNHGKHSMLITSVLSHVDPGNIFKIREVMRLFSAMSPILKSD